MKKFSIKLLLTSALLFGSIGLSAAEAERDKTIDRIYITQDGSTHHYDVDFNRPMGRTRETLLQRFRRGANRFIVDVHQDNNNECTIVAADEFIMTNNSIPYYFQISEQDDGTYITTPVQPVQPTQQQPIFRVVHVAVPVVPQGFVDPGTAIMQRRQAMADGARQAEAVLVPQIRHLSQTTHTQTRELERRTLQLRRAEEERQRAAHQADIERRRREGANSARRRAEARRTSAEHVNSRKETQLLALQEQLLETQRAKEEADRRAAELAQQLAALRESQNSATGPTPEGHLRRIPSESPESIHANSQSATPVEETEEDAAARKAARKAAKIARRQAVREAKQAQEEALAELKRQTNDYRAKRKVVRAATDIRQVELVAEAEEAKKTASEIPTFIDYLENLGETVFDQCKKRKDSLFKLPAPEVVVDEVAEIQDKATIAGPAEPVEIAPADPTVVSGGKKKKKKKKKSLSPTAKVKRNIERINDIIHPFIKPSEETEEPTAAQWNAAIKEIITAVENIIENCKTIQDSEVKGQIVEVILETEEFLHSASHSHYLDALENIYTLRGAIARFAITFITETCVNDRSDFMHTVLRLSRLHSRQKDFIDKETDFINESNGKIAEAMQNLEAEKDAKDIPCSKGRIKKAQKLLAIARAEAHTPHPDLEEAKKSDELYQEKSHDLAQVTIAFINEIIENAEDKESVENAIDIVEFLYDTLETSRTLSPHVTSAQFIKKTVEPYVQRLLEERYLQHFSTEKEEEEEEKTDQEYHVRILHSILKAINSIIAEEERAQTQAEAEAAAQQYHDQFVIADPYANLPGSEDEDASGPVACAASHPLARPQAQRMTEVHVVTIGRLVADIKRPIGTINDVKVLKFINTNITEVFPMYQNNWEELEPLFMAFGEVYDAWETKFGKGSEVMKKLDELLMMHPGVSGHGSVEAWLSS